MTSRDGRKRGRMEGKTVTSGQWLLRRKTGRREEGKTREREDERGEVKCWVSLG